MQIDKQANSQTTAKIHVNAISPMEIVDFSVWVDFVYDVQFPRSIYVHIFASGKFRIYMDYWTIW